MILGKGEPKMADKKVARKQCASKATPKAEKPVEVESKVVVDTKAELKANTPKTDEASKVIDNKDSKPKATTTKKTAPKKETTLEEIKETKTEPTAKAPAKKTTAKKAAAKKVEAKPVEEKKPVEDAKPAGKKILFCTSEAGPFIRSGGLGDVAGALPVALNKQGADCRVILPLYYDIPADFRNTMQYVGSVYVTLAWRYQYAGIFMSKYNGVTYYFIDNEYYFKRNGLYGHYDDAERFAFFSKACLEALPIIGFYPDVIHSNDWHTALVPVFLDTFYRGMDGYKFIKSVFTIHNIQFQGKYGKKLIQDILGMPEGSENLVEYGDCVNFMKGAIESANKVTTVSSTYAGEILSSYYAYGLEGILNNRSYKLSGIVNGIDEKLYDPMCDKALFKNYDLGHIVDKEENKRGLCEMLNLGYNKDVPIIGMVTRLTEQKGLDLVVRVIDDIIAKGAYLVVLGKGDWKYENILQNYQNKYPDKIRVIINFSQDIASKIYGGSDIFLMPSKFEPCGLSQMIAMRYGTVPIVRETGGLKDTVIPFNPVEKSGTGFTFYSYNAYDMLNAISRAIGTFHAKDEWDAVVKNGMTTDFSWDVSAKKYLDLYNSL